ncbi:MAG TPA: hypothetical protein VGX03_30545 [Candidatus Binatia bacterium]|nr:hypothetical protein [Candidatus Binatia bacterium]
MIVAVCSDLPLSIAVLISFVRLLRRYPYSLRVMANFPHAILTPPAAGRIPACQATG